MRVGSFFKHSQVFTVVFISLISLFVGCRRSSEELPVMPPVTHPLAREHIGYGVVNVSFTHLLSEPGAGGESRGHLRRGTVVRIIERRQVIIQEDSELWVLAEPAAETPSQGWLREATVEIFDMESRANTASRAMIP